jgi:hypothetical protein
MPRILNDASADSMSPSTWGIAFCETMLTVVTMGPTTASWSADSVADAAMTSTGTLAARREAVVEGRS